MLEVILFSLCWLLMTFCMTILFMLATYLSVEMSNEFMKELFRRND